MTEKEEKEVLEENQEKEEEPFTLSDVVPTSCYNVGYWPLGYTHRSK